MSITGRSHLALMLEFIVDSGASDVSIPADVVRTLIRTGTIKKSDFIGTETYRLADGSAVESGTFIIRSLKVGDRTVTDVRALGLDFFCDVEGWVYGRWTRRERPGRFPQQVHEKK